MDYDRAEAADMQSDYIDELRDEIKSLKKQLVEVEEINDIFNSIIQAAKILETWQYYELEVTDLENEVKYMVYLVNEETIDKLKELKLLHGG